MTNQVSHSENPRITEVSDEDRSRFVFEFLRSSSIGESSQLKQQVEIPRVVVQFWHDGNNVPCDVQKCMDSWIRLHNRGFQRIVFSDASAGKFVQAEYSEEHVAAFQRCHHPAMRADYFRLCYLVLHGGFYVDADEMLKSKEKELGRWFDDGRLKLQPLCYDKVLNEMVPPEIFLKGDRHNPDWTYYFNNNPIIGPKNHPILRLALERATNKLLESEDPSDIQSTTGPGNLTASLVAHGHHQEIWEDIAVVPDWESISESKWPLSYRNDERNWRLWNPKNPDSRI